MDLDVAFVITNQKKPYEGVVRPLVNFAKALRNTHEVSFFLSDCSEEFVKSFQHHQLRMVVCGKKSELISGLKECNPKFVMVDDDLSRLNLAKEIKKSVKGRTIAYVQILYGSHAIAGCFDLSYLSLKEKIVFRSARYLPFLHFSRKYAKVLRSFDFVIANSKVTATFLHSLYNVEADGVIYPPVDTDVFQSRSEKTRDEVTIYLGSHLGDVKQHFTEQIVEAATEEGCFVNLFGNPKIASSILRKTKSLVAYHSGLADLELAKMYSRSKLTVCPQKWEQFGMVPVESIGCGTPVLAFNCMGFQETISQATGWLANNEADFLQILRKVLENKGPLLKEISSRAVEEFSIRSSGSALEQLLEK